VSRNSTNLHDISTKRLKFTKFVINVLLAVHSGLCRISTPVTLCRSFHFSQFPLLHFGAVVSFLAISSAAFLLCRFHVSHFQSIPLISINDMSLWFNIIVKLINSTVTDTCKGYRPKNRTVFTQRRSVAKSIGCFQRRLFVCVCLFVNTITSERVNIGWWNLGVGALYKNLDRVRFWVSYPWVRTPKNVALDYDVGKISAGCLVRSL